MLYGDVGMQGKSDRVKVASAYVTCGNRQDGRSCRVKLVERKFMSSSGGDIIVLQTRNITPPLQHSLSPTLQDVYCSSFSD
jgi:hypothetical protein